MIKNFNDLYFKKVLCLVLGHRNEEIYCPYTKIMYNICSRCKPKHDTVLRFQ
jgi:hypothetical protein